MASPAHRSFRKHLKELETAIQDPGGLATSLYSDGLIDKVTKQRASIPSLSVLERSRELLDKLESNIKSDESVFDKFISIIDKEPTMKDIHNNLISSKDEFENESLPNSICSFKSKKFWILISIIIAIVAIIIYFNIDCYQPSVDHFVGREEDIHNITGYLDFTTSDVQVVHIVGPPGFGKSTLAMKIGDILMGRYVNVHYIDLRMVTDVDTMAETVLNVVEDVDKKVMFAHLMKFVQNQNSNTVLILDNCDELIEYAKDQFFGSVQSLTQASLRRNVRYILTSQKKVANVDNFRLHEIYSLSSKSAIKLLTRVAPSLTDDQKIEEIAKLTGNVPLAIKVIATIFIFPDAPSAEEVIENLKQNLIDTLSPEEIHGNVNGSLSVAYKYLSPELKQLCVNLSYFPGSFDIHIAKYIYKVKIKKVKELVRRSLLQRDRSLGIYFFHQLLATYFRGAGNTDTTSEHHFTTNYQLYYAIYLQEVLPVNGTIPDIKRLKMEGHNIVYLLNLFHNHRHVQHTFYAIKVISHEERFSLLLTFTQLPSDTAISMYNILNRYTTDERDSVDSFYETYLRVTILAAKAYKYEILSIHFLHTMKSIAEYGLVSEKISIGTYTMFYGALAHFYDQYGDKNKSLFYYSHILQVTKNRHNNCFPHCDYIRLSTAFEKVGERELAFKLREKAYNYQIEFGDLITEVKLWIDLYNDYLNTSLGNSREKAEAMAARIINDGFPFLIHKFGKVEFSEDVYYAAIAFFENRKMYNFSTILQDTMFNILIKQDKCRISELNCLESIFNKRVIYHCNHLAYLASIKYTHKVFNIANSDYRLGKYQRSMFLLTKSLNILNIVFDMKHSMELVLLRQNICYYLILSGDFINFKCYGYAIKYILRINATGTLNKVGTTQVIATKPIVLNWSITQPIHFLAKFLQDNPLINIFIYILIIISTSILSVIFILIVIANLMNCLCSEKQRIFCMSCFYYTMWLSISSTVMASLYLLFLDVLY